MGSVKDKMSFFKTNTNENCSKPRKKKQEANIVKRIENRIIRDIRKIFGLEEEDCYKPVRVCNFCNNNYIEYERNGDWNKNLSIKQYYNKIKQSLKGIMNNLKKSDTWKIQLTIANNFISSKDTHEKSVIKSDNIKFLNYDNGDEVGE